MVVDCVLALLALVNQQCGVLCPRRGSFALTGEHGEGFPILFDVRMMKNTGIGATNLCRCHLPESSLTDAWGSLWL
jgi:hypothetical protein